MLEGLTPPNSRSVYCKVAQELEALSSEDAAILNNALADRATWGSRTLSTALRARGLSIADTTLTKHRNGVCACYRG